MLITNEELYKKLETVDKKLDEIIQGKAEASIEEISLYRASRVLRLSDDTIIDLVKSGKLKARTYKDRNRKMRYRFRIADIKNFQDSEIYDHINLHADEFESAEEIASRFFPKVKEAAKC